MYTPEEVSMLVNEYTRAPTKDTIAELATRLGRSTKSITGKLSHEGIYKKQQYTTKTGEPPVTKKELVANISSLLKGDVAYLEGLDKAPKQALKYIITRLEAAQ